MGSNYFNDGSSIKIHVGADRGADRGYHSVCPLPLYDTYCTLYLRPTIPTNNNNFLTLPLTCAADVPLLMTFHIIASKIEVHINSNNSIMIRVEKDPSKLTAFNS